LTQKGDRADTLAKITAILAESSGRPELDEKTRKLEEAWVKSGDQVLFQLEALYGRDWPFEEI
jgi:hypothetical protein